MNTKLDYQQCRAPRRCKISSAISAALLGASLTAAQPGIAQEMMEGAAILHATKPPKPIRMTTAMAPVPAAAAGAAPAIQPLRGPDCTDEINEVTGVEVAVGKSTLVQLAEPARNRTLGNPAITMATLVSPRTLYVVGMAVGTTNMIVQGSSGACQMLDVIVTVDASGLQQSLTQLLPEERDIRVSSAAGNLVLGGRVSSASAAQLAMEIAKAYAAAQPTQQSQSSSSSAGGASTSQQASSTSAPGSVINMMTVDSPQQVMLEVKVAEVAKTLVDQLGSSLNLQGGFGSWTGALVSRMLSGASTIVAASKSNKLPLAAAIDAQKTDELTKILAEPNLVAISGQEASFLAGGRVFIPVAQSNTTGNGTTITLQEEEFGVGLKFTPTVLGNGRINLKVSPEVSELSPTGVAVSATGVNTTAILPLITTRRASTTVQMNDGESFAIGGLIGNNITGTLKAFPGLGELPVIGTLLRSTNFQQDRTELVFIITPHLVKPLPNSNYPLPTDSFTQPNAVDVYATGDMEGRGAKHRRAPAPGAAAPISASPQLVSAPAGAPTQPSAPPSGTTTQLPAAVAPRETESPSPAEPQPTPTVNIDPALLPRSASGRPATTAALPSRTVTQPASRDAIAVDEQTVRIARIERTAARLAAEENRRQIAMSKVSSAPTGQ
jgi:pilus assembly protein CpaC